MNEVVNVLTLLLLVGMLMFFILTIVYLANNLNCSCAYLGNTFTITLIAFTSLCMLINLTYVFQYGRRMFVGPELQYVEV